MMQDILKTLQRVYKNPVDIEYAVNCDEKGDFVVNLLQCRPLYVGKEGGKVEVPVLSKENCFLRLRIRPWEGLWNVRWIL